MIRLRRLSGILVALCSYQHLIISIILPGVESENTFMLPSGHKIPIIGFGTHGLDNEKLENLLTPALENGLRYIDTGFIYENEETIGQVLKKWFEKGGKRKDIFISSKFPFIDNHAESVEKYLKLSLEKLGLDYLDMYLIHAPFGVHHKNGSYDVAENEDGSVVLDNNVDHIAIWKAMEKQVTAGLVKSIGLSNFNETQVSKILEIATVKPSNLQIEVHLYHQQKGLRDFCKKNGIVVTAYAPLGSPGASLHFHPERNYLNPLELPVVKEIAKKHNKTAAQVLLRHTVQGGAVVIPSSQKVANIKANLDVANFELSEEEMRQLDSFDKGIDGKVFDFKFFKGIEKHLEYPFGNSVKG